MATGGSDDKSLAQIVECDICMEIMTLPQALHCLHHFCSECTDKLDRVTEGNISGIRCPTCRRFTPVESIQDSFMMKNLIEMYYRNQAMAQQEDVSRSNLCMQCDRPEVKHTCSVCQIELCESCKERHLRIPNCKDHNIRAIDAKDYVNVVKYCEKHPCNIIKHSCVPCNQAICTDCKIEDHDTHKTELADEALKRMLGYAKQNIHTIRDLNREVEIKLRNLRKTKEIFSLKLEEVKQKINAKSASVISKIDKDTKDLIEQLDMQNNGNRKELDIMEDDLQSKLASNESLLSWSNTVVNMTGPGTLCELQGGLLKKIESCAKETSSVKKSKDYKLAIFKTKFQPYETTSNIVGSLSSDKPDDFEMILQEESGSNEEDLWNDIQEMSMSADTNRRKTYQVRTAVEKARLREKDKEATKKPSKYRDNLKILEERLALRRREEPKKQHSSRGRPIEPLEGALRKQHASQGRPVPARAALIKQYDGSQGRPVEPAEGALRECPQKNQMDTQRPEPQPQRIARLSGRPRRERQPNNCQQQ